MYKVAYHEFDFRPWYLVRRLTKMRSCDDIVCNVRALRSVMFTKTTRPPSADARPASRRWGLGPFVEPCSPAAACT
jgi:hypothetical protein